MVAAGAGSPFEAPRSVQLLPPLVERYMPLVMPPVFEMDGGVRTRSHIAAYTIFWSSGHTLASTPEVESETNKTLVQLTPALVDLYMPLSWLKERKPIPDANRRLGFRG